MGTMDIKRNSLWDQDEAYGRRFYDRAVGRSPEMECSKAVANILKDIIKADYSLLDAGCGAGHYLRSLKKEIQYSICYTGIDATWKYIELAKKAWEGIDKVTFRVADIFSLPFEDRSFDIAMSCNVFLHLPSVEVPLKELIRVSRSHVLIRTLIGDRSFRIKEVFTFETHPDMFTGNRGDKEYDQDGEPLCFNYYNIYSVAYIEKVLSEMPEIESFSIISDKFYDENKISAERSPQSPPDQTRIIDGMQANGYIIQPWSFLEITKKGL